MTEGAVNLKVPDATVAATKIGQTAESDGDTGLKLTLTVTDITTPPTLIFNAPGGSTTDIAADGTGAVVSPDGVLVIGTTAPQVTDAAGTDVRASWSATTRADEAPAVTLVLSGSTPPALPLTVTAHLGTTVIAGTAWGNREGGESLAVTPSDWGRVSGFIGQEYGWANLVAVEARADTSVMDKQLRCHMLGAPDKATWNLEPWRPDVSFIKYALAKCNPT